MHERTHESTPDARTRLRARPLRAVLVTALLAVAFAGGTLLAPVLQADHPRLAAWIHLAYAPLCHQMDERSLAVGAGVQAVCARCSGLYAGGVLGLFAAWLLVVGRTRSIRPLWFVVALAPTGLDALLPWLGLPALSEVPRWWISVPAGAMAGAFLALGVADLFEPRAPVRARPIVTRPVEETDV